MRTPLEKVQWSAQYGIALRHWTRFASCAERNRLFLFVRGGKPTAIPWIELGFPGKPMELGFLKVEPRTGLLWATSAAERTRVFGTGNLVLDRVASALRAVGPSGPAGPRVYTQPWAGAGVVIERQYGLPFTSDYDLAAVIPLDDFDYIQDVAGVLIGKSRTSGLAERVRAELNREFGSARLLHGPQALYDQQLGHGPDERIIAFCPDGDVYAFRTGMSEAESVMQYRDLLVALQPEKAEQFRH